ncbi:hypothetical protein CERSUDRAFT_49567 [Gelatoporia subvermispora B]|uniref:Fe2OG dioxygenase domain-containing protein n=1 Tax=Ceriporiopsis subvermispora (strain B) TaxID=914234 RepID=M2RHS9_CERS8|nr:hypothetical protein CERSUDRAFT_49567 [Gelatoporia subvermispora B]
MRILRPDHASEEREKVKETPPRFPPLTLATPTLIAQHTPCTLHTSVLPAELACRLFYAMLAESQNWQRNKWWLFDRVVESPHRTSFYVRQSESKDEDMHQAAQYWYNGRQVAPPPPFPPAMEAACDFIERVVNAEMRKRKRFPLEWGGETADTGENTSEQVIWRANVAASNCYEGAKESVGYHSDQLTNLGPYPTIASLSLGTSRTFRLREVVPLDEKEERSARTYNIPLQHNSLIIMHASTQEMYKHCIPPQNAIDMFHPPFPSPYDEKEDFESGFASNCRINITFRFYRPDFKASSIPKCRCGVPCILRPDMKNRYSSVDGERKDMVAKYWWTCYAGAQNDGKGCDFWKVMDVHQEGRGPFVGFSK